MSYLVKMQLLALITTIMFPVQETQKSKGTVAYHFVSLDDALPKEVTKDIRLEFSMTPQGDLRTIEGMVINKVQFRSLLAPLAKSKGEIFIIRFTSEDRTTINVVFAFINSMREVLPDGAALTIYFRCKSLSPK